MPFTEKSAPPVSPLSRASKLFAVETPGDNVTKPMKFSPFSGNSRTCVPEITSPTAAVVVCTCTSLASTVMVSVTAPTVSWAFTSVDVCTSTFFERNSLKPACLISTLYTPTGTCAKVKLPDSVVVVVSEAFVPILVKVTDAPAIAAPPGSVTEPVMVPEYCCACAAKGIATASSKTQNSARAKDCTL